MITSHDEEFARVRDVLSRHKGRHNPIPIDRLAFEAGILDDEGRPYRRRCEQILQICKDDFPFIVVGSGRGMFVATDPEDLNRELASRESRIREIRIGLLTLKRKAVKQGWTLERDRFTAAPIQQELFT